MISVSVRGVPGPYVDADRLSFQVIIDYLKRGASTSCASPEAKLMTYTDNAHERLRTPRDVELYLR